MDLIGAVKATGMVEVGEAGFPAHTKLSTGAECFVVNGAECKPLIGTDKHLMHTSPDRIVQAVSAVATYVGARRTVIALKKKYVKGIAVLRWATAISGMRVGLFEMPSFYPTGDGQVLVQWICDTSIPEHGIPLDVGTVVDNVGTLLSIHDALQGILVTKKCLSVVGEVKCPAMRKIPLGTPLRKCIGGARSHLQDYIMIIGSPTMGRVVTDPAEIDRLAVTKTTGNLIVLSDKRYLAHRTALPLGRIKTQIKGACIQYRIYTSLCSWYLIGRQIQPHLIVRNLFREEPIFNSGEHEKALGQTVNCCDCSVCETFSCPTGLSPRKVNAYLKDGLHEKDTQVSRNLSLRTRERSLYGKVSTDRLVARLGLPRYYHQHVGDNCTKFFPE